MATGTSALTDLELLHRFVEQKLANGCRKMTVDECLAEFREYLDELERCREAIRPSLERSLRGESGPFDPEDVIRRGRERLRQKGITD